MDVEKDVQRQDAGQDLRVFTLKDMNLHRLLSGKHKSNVISKTLERGRKFRNEG